MKKFREVFFDPQTVYDEMSYKKKLKTFNIRTIDKFDKRELKEIETRLRAKFSYVH